jgi:hypothetical protein
MPRDLVADRWLHELGRIEIAYRARARSVLQILPPDDDRAAAVRRVLESFEH